MTRPWPDPIKPLWPQRIHVYFYFTYTYAHIVCVTSLSSPCVCVYFTVSTVCSIEPLLHRVLRAAHCSINHTCPCWGDSIPSSLSRIITTLIGPPSTLWIHPYTQNVQASVCKQGGLCPTLLKRATKRFGQKDLSFLSYLLSHGLGVFPHPH